jgi:hypothetical protein
MNSNKNDYKKILIDNSICKRRFHLVYDEDSPSVEHVVIKCPHCSVVLFEKYDHPDVLLAREENLVKSPEGDVAIMYNCNFKAN